MFKVPKHIWRTDDGTLVPDGHLDAAFLAYAAGTELPDHEAKSNGLHDVYPEAAKAKAKPADKAAAKPADKAAPKGGVTITRLSDQK